MCCTMVPTCPQLEVNVLESSSIGGRLHCNVFNICSAMVMCSLVLNLMLRSLFSDVMFFCIADGQCQDDVIDDTDDTDDMDDDDHVERPDDQPRTEIGTLVFLKI